MHSMMNPGKPDVDQNSEQDMSETSTLSGIEDDYEPVPVPSKIRNAPTNYLHVSKRDIAISGQYFIDLSIPPVPQTVPHIVAGTENLFLKATGTVTANVWVTGNNKLRRVSMKLFSDTGDVDAKVHDAFFASESERRPSLDIHIRAHGGISLSLPCFFRGLITIRPSREAITLSPALEERAALLSDVTGARVYFVGNRPRSWMLSKEEAAAGAGSDSDEPLDRLSVGSWSSALQIYWDGEPGFPR
ncbi:hypothetical protein V8E53_007507 [Lactarius tabidus]